MEDNKSNWGGKRDGAGRKKSEKVYKTVSICGTEDEIDTLKKLAADKDVSLSKFIVAELLKENYDKDN